MCAACMKTLQPIGPQCRHCALPLADALFPCCGRCLREKPCFDTVYCAWRYLEPLQSILHAFKYRQALFWSGFLAERILDALPDTMTLPECLVPVPLHRHRLRERGYNQSTLIAQKLAKMLSLPLVHNGCMRLRDTRPQAGTSAASRRVNLQNAFAARPTTFQHIALIDDVLTTGSTASAVAAALKQQGVKRVDVWCCARA